MTHPQMSYKPYLSSESTGDDFALPTHIDPAFASYRKVVKPSLLKGLVMGLVILAASCFSLHLFSHKHPVYSDPLQVYRTRGMARFNANHTANTDFIADLNNQYNMTLPVPDSNLARRQTGDKKQWFFIPIASSRYCFASRGLIDQSTFSLVPFRSSRDHMVVKVEVVKDPQYSARASILRYTWDGEPYGLELYNDNSERWDKSAAPAFNVVVYIPIPDRRLRLNNFVTNLPQFEHAFADLSRYVEFSQLWLSALNVPMSLGSQVADKIRVSNSNAPITGKLTAGLEIALLNQNGKIDGEYMLNHAGGSLKISNINSAISAGVRLRSRDTTSRSAYHVEVSNRGGSTDLRVLEQPMGSALFLKASSIWSNLRVHLNQAFKGRFKVNTGRTPPAIYINLKDKHDPTGRGRKRVVQFDEGSLKRSGQAKWEGGDGTSDHPYGDVSLSNSGGGTELFFD